MADWAIERYAAVGSTQDVARQRLQPGRVVVAGWQRQGRGRHGRAWTAPPGRALLFSAVLPAPEQIAPILPLLAGVAVCDALASVPAGLKWPNDVLVKGRKLAGILVERPPGPCAVVGIGINANLEAADLPGEATTSLLVVTGHPVDLEALLQDVLAQLDAWLARAAAGGSQVIAQAWRQRTGMLGRPVEVLVSEQLVRGVAQDITDSGALLLRHPDGRVETLVAGEVQRVRWLEA